MLSEQGLQIRTLLRSGELVEIGGRPQPPATVVTMVGPRTAHLVLAFAAIYLIWGSTYLAIRYAIETIPPLLMMGLRHLTAGLVLYAWVRLRGTPAPLRKYWKPAIIAGALFFLGGHGTLAWAEQQVPSGLAALLCATLPLWIVLLTRITGQKRNLEWSVMSGVLLGFLGVALLIGPAALHGDSGISLLGFAMALLGALLWAVGTIYTQHVELPASASLSAAMQMIAGGATLCVTSMFAGESGRVHLAAITAKSVLSLAYLTMFGSLIAFSAFTWLHKVSSPTKNSTYAYVNPVVAVFLGWFLAGEAIGARTLLATSVILAGVALVSRKTASHQEQREADQLSLPDAEEELCGAD
jgi:drug/metabolite transporter (DMT)-like permease